MSPTSSELTRNQSTVSDLNAADVRARKPIADSMRIAKSSGTTFGAAVTSMNVSRRRSGGKIRVAFEKVVYSSGRGGNRGSPCD
ncbi:hypothetical protein [Acinetobacter sp. ANC 5414]|uniref:hypothetical protein n=1 Tax=Acinetobacter sp. ANC 5414 TaxID=2731251 RepID=UPI00202EC280|nr:hypothetical protein [Acinetobacter sp. ANC 5414]